ncbi:MAG: bifunctional hydroxymethylpyrimidine kinase/phosphomethylpyrimidine kinase [Rhodobacteraceae bacterium]|nr:bifunctional hydroxymethylpyrimidine kinase/phosphomethylpyrimidine kinase [Paracoccaceae bacterium]
MTAIAVTIAGSDSGGGAGIQADLKSFSANGVYGASVLAALTAQNTLGVTAVQDLPVEFIRAQMDAVYSDLAVGATKIGMLSRTEVIRAVAEGLKTYHTGSVVLDPVMVAASGDPLLADEAVSALVGDLFPLVDLVTPNLHEAARILNTDVAVNNPQMEQQALAILALGAKAVLLKGGHGDGQESSDLLARPEGMIWYSAPRHDSQNTHGTGCTLSSAIAAHLAKGADMRDAVQVAKTYISEAIAAADTLDIGSGHGPVHHFYAMWD